MGGWKKTIPVAYFVSWDDEGIVKAGYSAQQHWRRFALRGARVIQLSAFDDFRHAFDLETEYHQYISARWPAAFSNIDESRPFVGADGGGYKECYRMPRTDAQALLTHMRTHCPSIMLAHCSGIALPPCTYLTDGRTNARVSHIQRNISPNATCAGGLKDSLRLDAETGRCDHRSQASA